MADRHSIPVGTTFNRWTYLGHDRLTSQGVVSLFRCACGTERIVKRSSVKTGQSKSCGCQRVDSARLQNRTHGRSKDGAGSAYVSWSGLFRRCYNPKFSSYENYGGRGIKVCERWHRFENFLEDMGDRPPGTTLDRWPDKNGDYEPGNCRWATTSEQMFNTRRTIDVQHSGRRVTTGDLAKEAGISMDLIRHRLKSGMTVNQAINASNLNERQIEHNGLSMSMAAWERHLGLNRGTVETRLRRGKSVEEALAPVQSRHRKK